MKGRVVLLVLAAVLLLAATAGQAWAVRYVALGDSYSSGTGTRTYYDSACEKSVYSYPYLVHNAHPSWTFVHAACGGAKTGDVINTQSAQLTSGTNWVTYTIGGNDAGFSSVITECAQPGWASDCNSAIDGAQTYITNTLPGRLDLVNNKIKSKSPTAKVIVLSYPRLFMGEDCNAGTFFSAAEMTRLNTDSEHAQGQAEGCRDTRRGELRVQGRHPPVRRARGLRLGRVAERPLEPGLGVVPPEQDRALERLQAAGDGSDGVKAGLCDACKWQKLIRNTRGSTFSMCRHPELPKYPRLPVVECRGYEPRERGSDP